MPTPCALAQQWCASFRCKRGALGLLKFALLFVDRTPFHCIFFTPVVAFLKKTVAHNPLANRCPKPTISLPRGGVFAPFVDGFNPLTTQTQFGRFATKQTVVWLRQTNVVLHRETSVFHAKCT